MEFNFKELNENICSVVFTKVSTGEERKIKCTKCMEKIPCEFHPKTDGESKNPRKKKEGIQCVFDLEKNGWRSFREDSVKEFIVL